MGINLVMPKNATILKNFSLFDKLDQNEDLAHLRADMSLTKTQMTIDAKKESDRFKQRDVRILKGPRR